MPRANPDYAGITKAAQAISRAEVQDLDADPKAADTLSGRTDIVWSSSRTVATTEHTAESPTAPAEVIHTARFRVDPKTLPTVRLEYGSVRFWPELVQVKWVGGELSTVLVMGHQAKKTGDGIGKDERARPYPNPYIRRWAFRGDPQPPFDRTKIPAKLRGVISRYEVKVPVASPSPGVGPVIVSSRTGLTNVPDGTIITWLRIPGDSTSEAVAFVRHEDDYDSPTTYGGPSRVTWVSPGGWHPQSPEDAGVTYPCVAHTEIVTGCPTAATPEEVEIQAVADHRRDALFAAALVYQGNGTEASADWLNGQVTALADGLAEWLTPPLVPSLIAEAIDHPSPARLSPAAIDGVVAEFKARLARKGWIPSRINMVGDQLHVILTESFGGGQ